MVILGSHEACNDLFERRSANYSDRPRMIMLNELYVLQCGMEKPKLMRSTNRMSWDWFMTTMKYGESWRTRRRTFHQFFNMNRVHEYRPIQLREARALLTRLLKSPEQFAHHLRQ
jgi:cytochrome P450